MSDSKKEIWINEDFTASSVKEVRDSIVNISAENPIKPIVIYINSYGGNVDSLNLLLDTFNEVPNEIITVCMGTAMSVGAILLSAGDKRFVSPNARIMMHEVSSQSAGTATELKDQTAETLRLNKQLLKIISKNTGKSLAQIRTMLKNKPDVFFTAKEALRFGLVDYIGSPSIIETAMYHIVLDNKKVLTDSNKKITVKKKEKKR